MGDSIVNMGFGSDYPTLAVFVSTMLASLRARSATWPVTTATRMGSATSLAVYKVCMLPRAHLVFVCASPLWELYVIVSTHARCMHTYASGDVS